MRRREAGDPNRFARDLSDEMPSRSDPGASDNGNGDGNGDGEPEGHRAAFYAASSPGGWRDWWTLLHPPYTAWHLAYVVIGASLVTHPNVTRLVATVLAFFAAVGVAAHALDELHGHPLRTRISNRALVAVG